MARTALPSERRVGLALALAAIAAVLWAPSTAVAAPNELFLSEYVEGTGNNRALEIYNGRSTGVDLSAYKVQFYTNGRSSPSLTLFLQGTVAPGDVFVLASSSAVQDVRAQADQLTGSMPMTGNDAIVLRNGGGIIDSIGQVGVDPGTEWGSGMTSTMDNTLRRKRAVTAGDGNATDAFDPSAEWEGLPADTFDGLGWHTLCDTTAPTLAVAAAPGLLWPPNHKRVSVDALVSVTDDTDPHPSVGLVSVTSNEPDDARGNGDGHTSGDVQLVDGDSFLLRAERSASGSGRVYTITYRATDACDNAAQAAATVLVPLSSGS